MFTPINGDSALLRKDGVFRVCGLFSDRRGRLFAKYGSGFVALKATAETSVVGLLLDEIDTEEQLFVSKIGNLYVAPGPDRIELDKHHRVHTALTHLKGEAL